MGNNVPVEANYGRLMYIALDADEHDWLEEVLSQPDLGWKAFCDAFLARFLAPGWQDTEIKKVYRFHAGSRESLPDMFTRFRATLARSRLPETDKGALFAIMDCLPSRLKAAVLTRHRYHPFVTVPAVMREAEELVADEPALVAAPQAANRGGSQRVPKCRVHPEAFHTDAQCYAQGRGQQVQRPAPRPAAAPALRGKLPSCQAAKSRDTGPCWTSGG
jgi:hypothetical protein